MSREGRREGVVPMEPAIRKVVAVLAVALIVVIGFILVTRGAKKDAAVTTQDEIKAQEKLNTEAQADEDAEPQAQKLPNDAAQAGETGATSEAQDDEAQNKMMYEGALAGLSEEEIAKMALAEEGSAERSQTTGVEDAVD